MTHTAIVFGDNGHGWARRVERKKYERSGCVSLILSYVE